MRSLVAALVVSLGLLVATVHDGALAQAGATEARASGGPVDRALLEDLAAASRILADQGVLDAFGHVSIRHGNVATGPSLQIAVFRAVYTEVNARLELQAIAIGGPINALTPEEGVKADKVSEQIVGRPWDLWKQRIGGK